MIACAISPKPVPRISANRTLSLSPYNTGYADAIWLAQMSIAMQHASTSSL